MLEYVALAQNHFGVQFKQVSPSEFKSIDGCPKCGSSGGNTDRFKLFLEPHGRAEGPRVWCRRCGFLQYLNSLDGNGGVTQEDIARMRQQAKEHREEQREAQKVVLARMQGSDVHVKYHKNLLDGSAMPYDYWMGEGIQFPTMQLLNLGYCPKCPTAPDYDSFTMPVVYDGQLWNVRHRLREPNGSGKYRPEAAGLPLILWNADDLHAGTDEVLVLEGEKKQIVVKQETGLASVATMGDRVFLESWGHHFADFKRVYVCQDPGSEEHAKRIAGIIGSHAVTMSLPVKADDFFVRYNGTSEQFKQYMSMAA